MHRPLYLVPLLLLASCSSNSASNAVTPVDSGVADGGVPDGGVVDGGVVERGAADSGVPDGELQDAERQNDTGTDARDATSETNPLEGGPGGDASVGPCTDVASAGPAELPGLLSAYHSRAPWTVAGVDYGVGVNAGVTLQNPLNNGTLVPALTALGGSYDSGNGLITFSGHDNITVSGWDFSVSGGLGILLQSVSNVTITNNKFKVGTNLLNPISVETSVDGITISHNDIDGAGLENDHTVGQGLIEFNGYGQSTIEYNYIQNAFSELMVIGNSSSGSSAVLVQCNLGMNAGLGANDGAHGDWVQIVSASAYAPNTIAATFSFNTFVQSDPSTEARSQGLSFNGNVHYDFSGDVMSNNTVIASGAGSINTFFNADYSWLNGPGQILDNYVDPTGMSDSIDNWATVVGGTGPYSDHFVGSNNVNMVTGTSFPNL